ncbi:hypothetical protein MKZ38_001474 [Zalerion maritima]|uniref:Phytanoyl-CoA dioxygenase n=1 Tax=Zalerion maritima TaxID=339359 RepID=A0AAD5RXV4_9PEZI|nr:hypothetical protein MKZ38_001474 [Zalerion maritima]
MAQPTVSNENSRRLLQPTTTSPTDPSGKSKLLQQLTEDGFVVIPSLLSPELLASLRDACAAVTRLGRTGEWPHVRTMGKQFPPWPRDKETIVRAGIWGVQGLMNPSLHPEHSRLFAAAYFSDAVLDPVCELLACGRGELVMELLNLLVRPAGSFELRWHRDDVPSAAPEDEERERLGLGAAEGGAGGAGGGKKKARHAQYNLALYPDDSLIVIPGSHSRVRTKLEREAGDYEEELPDMLKVHLNEGDCVFYDNNILHRGVYDESKERMTLHGSVGHVAAGTKRARNVLQHGVGEWVGECDFKELGETAEGMRKRLMELGRDAGPDVGFSLEG